MKIIGLTGSIATGKSTVSHLLSCRPFSLPVVDADLLARQVVEPGTSGYDAIVKHFGPSTPDLLLPLNSDSDSNPNLNSSSSSTLESTRASDSGPKSTVSAQEQEAQETQKPLNRAVLGRRVFGNDAGRRRDRKILEGIIHPAVRRAMFAAVAKAYFRGERAVVLDVPLLFEAGLDVFCATVIVVGVRDQKVQVERLRRRDTNLTEEEAWGRVRSQGTLEWKVERANGWGRVVWNDGSKDDLKKEVELVMADILQSSETWMWVLWLLPPVMVVLAAWGLAKGVWRQWRWQRTHKGKDKVP